MDGRWSDWQVQRWLDELGPTWLGLFASDPFAASDPLMVEHFAPTYSRPPMTFSRTGPRLLTSAAAASWQGLPVGAPVAAIGGFDAPVNGRLRFALPEADDAVIRPGGLYSLPAGSIYLGVDL